MGIPRLGGRLLGTQSFGYHGGWILASPRLSMEVSRRISQRARSLWPDNNGFELGLPLLTGLRS